MIRNLSIMPKDQYLPNIQDSLSNVSKADSVVKKIIKVAELIILLPWLIIKDSAHHLKRCFVKKNFNSRASQNFIVRHSSAILKGALVGGVCLGLFKLRGLAGIQEQSFLDKFVAPVGAITAKAVAALGFAAFISIPYNKELVSKSELDDPFIDSSSISDMNRKYEEIERKLESEQKAYESLNCLTLLFKKYKLNSINHKIGLLNIRSLAKEFDLEKGAKVRMAQSTENFDDMHMSRGDLENIIRKLRAVKDNAAGFDITKELKPKLLDLITEFNKQIEDLEKHLSSL